MNGKIRVMTRGGTERNFTTTDIHADSVKLEVDGLVITVLRRPIPHYAEHGLIDIRIDPLNGAAVGIEHEHTQIDRTQVHLQLIADNSGRGILPPEPGS